MSKLTYSSWDSIRRSGLTSRALRISDLYSLSQSVTPITLRKCPISAVCSFDSIFSVVTTKGEDRNKDQFKNCKLCSLSKLPFCHHGEIKLTQNCVCSTNPCINLFVPTSVTHGYHHKVLERLHVLCVVYFRSLAEYTALGVLRDTIPKSF